MNGLNNLRIGRIPYANVLPIYYGFDNNLLEANFNFINAHPAKLNALMLKNNLDISPMSTFELLKNLDKFYILDDLSISCNGPVRSVILASHYLLKDLNDKKLVLTTESSTSAHILKVLLKESRINPNYYRENIVTTKNFYNDCDAALIIGDKALNESWKKNFKYTYDLGELWHRKYKAPLYFALWGVRREISDKHPEEISYINKMFKKSKEMGLKNIKKIEETASKKLNLPLEIAKDYYENLNYDLSTSIDYLEFGYLLNLV